MGTISKAPYNPAAHNPAAFNPAAHRARLAAQQALLSPTAVRAAGFVSRMEQVKQMEIMKKVSFRR